MTNPPYGDAEPRRSPPPDGSGPPAPGAVPYGPGFGAPGYGGPPRTPARRRSRAVLVALLAAVTAAVVAGLTVLALSTGPVVLSRTAVERDVAAQFAQREGVAVDLRCTQEMTVRNGATYECSGVTADDEQITLRIEITDEDAARYTWTEP